MSNDPSPESASGGFEPVIERLSSRTDVVRITGAEVASMLSEYPGIPAEYLEFLNRVGFGNLGELQFYEGPVPAGDVYPRLKGLTTILLTCDDFQGYCYGFDVASGFALVEICPKGVVSHSGFDSFSAFIVSYFGGHDS